MAVMRSKMRSLESTTVSAMRSTRSELAKVVRATGRTSALTVEARLSRHSSVRLASASAGAMVQGAGTAWASSQP